MELKLNIYNELDDIEKTYTRQTYKLRMRQLKDIINTLDLDHLAMIFKGGTNIELFEIVANIVVGAYERVQELVKDVFPGLTDEEFENTHIDEVVNVIVDLVKYTFATIQLAGTSKEKN